MQYTDPRTLYNTWSYLYFYHKFDSTVCFLFTFIYIGSYSRVFLALPPVPPPPHLSHLYVYDFIEKCSKTFTVYIYIILKCQPVDTRKERKIFFTHFNIPLDCRKTVILWSFVKAFVEVYRQQGIGSAPVTEHIHIHENIIT